MGNPVRWLRRQGCSNWRQTKDGLTKLPKSLGKIRISLWRPPACRVRTGSVPQIRAALRNAGLSLFRALKIPSIAAALRRRAARPLEAIQIVTNLVPC
jgi:hypothetical protein